MRTFIYLMKTIKYMNSRRQFLKVSGVGLAAAAFSPLLQAAPVKGRQSKTADLFQIGMAGYTFREFTVDQTIAMMKRVAVTNLSVKDFHMPMNSTQEQIDTIIGKFRAEGINVYTVGVVYMKSNAEADQAFRYAMMAGVKMMVGAPNYDLLPYVEKKIKETGISLAIHNHGPDNPLYHNATDIWDHVSKLDPRLGICLDIGHTLRDGDDPAADILRYRDRIFDIHIKDVDKASKEGKTVEMGRGLIDIPSVVKALRKINYSGKCSLEFEKDMKDSLAGIAESIGYFRGVMACG